VPQKVNKIKIYDINFTRKKKSFVTFKSDSTVFPHFHFKRSKAILNRPHLDFTVHFYIKFEPTKKSAWTRKFGLLLVLKVNTVVFLNINPFVFIMSQTVNRKNPSWYFFWNLIRSTACYEVRTWSTIKNVYKIFSLEIYAAPTIIYSSDKYLYVTYNVFFLYDLLNNCISVVVSIKINNKLRTVTLTLYFLFVHKQILFKL
jgi:hypothetical protein